ncbi:MAG: TerC family protein [Saprospiraceae bacterium]|nr:TerC family protein [Candidatus Vicinibacter affinis]
MVEIIIALVTLVALEIILGIDNVIFISILSSKLPKEMQKRARQIGLFLAMFMRLGLLTVITWIMKLKNDLFVILDNGISGKDLILIAGGLFLVYKSSTEIYHKTEGEEGDESKEFNKLSFNAVIVQIMIMDLVFSLDSIITAVGLAEHLWVMCTAVIISVGIMMWAATPVADFVDRHPAFKILALSFLLLIGFALVAEGFDVHIPKGYIYFSMGFAFLVNLIQMRTGKKTKTKPVELHEHYTEAEEDLPKDVF